MKKEEFLAFSFPYGLKCKLNNVGRFNLDEEYPEPHNEICEITNILKSNKDFEYEISDGNISYGFIESDEFDPILHPLSDLTKEIEHNGERFIPLHRLLERSSFNLSIMTNDDIMEFKDIFFNVNLITINELYLYLGWHFDIAGLIEKGEAIDVNTLNENPYK